MSPLRPTGCALLLLFAASCGGEPEDAAEGKSADQLRREIEAVADPKPLPKDLPSPFRLRPLKVAEVRDYVADRPACMLVYRDRIFFATKGLEGMARIDGRLVRLAANGPVAGSGGFFSAEGATLSIGRISQYAGRAAAYVPGWPVEVAVGGAKDIKPQEFEGSWTCRDRFAPEQVRPVATLPPIAA
jgi:hypothetical protein